MATGHFFLSCPVLCFVEQVRREHSKKNFPPSYRTEQQDNPDLMAISDSKGLIKSLVKDHWNVLKSFPIGCSGRSIDDRSLCL